MVTAIVYSEYRYYEHKNREAIMTPSAVVWIDFSMPNRSSGKPFVDEKNFYCENN